MNKYFKEVIITSEADLPKEEGFYTFNKKVKTFGRAQTRYYHPVQSHKPSLIKKYASYLLPVEPGVLYEKVSGAMDEIFDSGATIVGEDIKQKKSVWLRPIQ